MAEAAVKKVPTQAERQAQIAAETQESNTRILAFIRGAAKAVTTDLPGFVADVIDKISGDTSTLGEKDRSEQMFSAATGWKKSEGKSGEKAAETLGSFTDPKNILKAIIVPAFLTKSLKDVKTAERALNSGISGDKVVDATGIFRLPEHVDDGVLRTVIHPGLAEFNPRALNFDQTNITGTRSLEDTINFPELFNRVPDLKNYQLIVEPGLPVNNAYHNDKNRVIGLGNASSKEDLMKTILHEIQHGVQMKFNMNEGANPTMFYQDVNAADRAKNALARKYNQGDKSVYKSWKMLDHVESQALKNYKRTAGETEARAVEAMRVWPGKIDRPLDYYGNEYDLNRMIRSPQEVPKVDSDPVIQQIIKDALASSSTPVSAKK